MSSLEIIVAGQINLEFIIDGRKRAFQNILGGSLLYSASALNLTGDRIGLVSAIPTYFPVDWQTQLSSFGFGLDGIKSISDLADPRAFYAYPTGRDCIRDLPAKVYAEYGLPFPKELLGYEFLDDTSSPQFQDTCRQIMQNVPSDYLDALAAHLCPLDLTSHLYLTTLLQNGAIRLMTLQSHPSYMQPRLWETVRVLTTDLTAFISTEIELRNLFCGSTESFRDMATALCELGCEFILMKEARNGYRLFNASHSSIFHIPDYPGEQIDPTGCMDAFCGGFLSGYRTTYDPLEAAFQGSASASIKAEGTGPFTAYSSLPGLQRARIERIREMSSPV